MTSLILGLIVGFIGGIIVIRLIQEVHAFIHGDDPDVEELIRKGIKKYDTK